MKSRLLYVFYISCLFSGLAGWAQNYSSLPSDEKQHIRIQSYILFHLDSTTIDELEFVIDNKLPIAIYPSYSKEINSIFFEEFSKKKRNILVLNSIDSTKINLKSLSTTRVLKSDVDSIHISEQSLIKGSLGFDGVQELGLITIQKGLIIADSVYVNLWNRSGKLPNFIYADRTNLRNVARIVQLLNETQKVYGVVRTEDELLIDVSFENFKNRNVSGYFSFPLVGEGIIPHKAGYYFSPDIIIPTLENQGNLKEFVGYPLDPNYRLEYHFTFGKSVENSVKNGNNEFLSNDVISKKDSVHGNVGYFSNRAYIDTGIAGKSALKSNFSIAAWIKPTQLNTANGILSKGFNFVVKIHGGHLTFTSAGIKDYKSLSSPIPINKWTHIGLVHSSINNDLTFYINGVQTDKIEMIAEYENSEYNLLVGNNIWEEFFVGYLSGIKIWERELNATEMMVEFNFVPNKGGLQKVFLISIFGILAVGLLLLLFNKKWKVKKNKIKRTPSKYIVDVDSQNYTEKILCFGELRIENSNGKNIAVKFSPMLKKIFVIIFLHSQHKNRGISTKNLTEFIWPGLDAKRAKNTRGTTIQNLRSILADCKEIELVFKDKLWCFELSDTCYCDLLEAQVLLDLIRVNNHSIQLLESKLPRLLMVLSKGRFLSNSSEPWLDSFVEKFSIELIEECFKYVEMLNLKKHHELLFSISEVIYLYDDLNEKALQIKLNVLMYQGKLSLARTTFDNFSKLYRNIYKEAYPVDFDHLKLKKSNF